MGASTKIVFDGKYTWDGGFGAWFKSHEREVSVGDVRHIRGRLFYAHEVRGREVWWCSVDEPKGYQELVEFRNRL